MGQPTKGNNEEQTETILDIEVPPGQAADTRLDVYLTRVLANATRTKVQRGIKEGRVHVNGRKAKASYTVQPGDNIVCRLLRPPPIEAKPEDIPLDIRYEDEHLLVVNKPAGMVVHPAYGNRTGTLVNALLFHTNSGHLRADGSGADDVNLSTSTALPSSREDPAIRPGLVHRLDKDTSGVMVVAKDDWIHASLAQQFFHRTIGRHYEAIVWGKPKLNSGRIENSLGRDPRDRKRVTVLPEDKGKRAITDFELLESLYHTSLLAFRLKTGRTHQIRVHAQYAGFPIFGDPVYGGRSLRVERRQKPLFKSLLQQIRRQALHARSLSFEHPATREQLHFECELPADMQSVLDELRRESRP